MNYWAVFLQLCIIYGINIPKVIIISVFQLSTNLPGRLVDEVSLLRGITVISKCYKDLYPTVEWSSKQPLPKLKEIATFSTLM